MKANVFRSRWPMAATVLSVSLLTACASAPGHGHNPQDPWETYNRNMDSFNQSVDEAVFKPVATVYRDATPRLVRTGVSNFFGNLGDAWSFANHALQASLEPAMSSFFRFSINSTMGLLGVLDVATEMGLEREKTDFGLTMDRWGMPTGPYVVLPLLGPSTLRDTLVMPVESWGNPLSHVTPVSDRNVLYGLRLVDTRARLLRVGDMLDGAALDKYSFTRDAYLQLRHTSVIDGAGSFEDMDGAQPVGMDSGAGYIPPEPLDAAAPAGER